MKPTEQQAIYDMATEYANGNHAVHIGRRAEYHAFIAGFEKAISLQPEWVSDDETDCSSAYNQGYLDAKNDLEPKWIDVDEQKPDYGKYVVVWCRIYGRYITRYMDTENGGQWKDHLGQYGGLPPLKWAEILLPEIPKED